MSHEISQLLAIKGIIYYIYRHLPDKQSNKNIRFQDIIKMSVIVSKIIGLLNENNCDGAQPTQNNKYFYIDFSLKDSLTVLLSVKSPKIHTWRIFVSILPTR